MNKKYYLFAAAAAVLSLTACSSDDDAVQANGAKTVAVNQAVDFDIYTASATRAGDAGIQTTSTLQTADKGFGVFAQYSDGTSSTDGAYSTTVSPSNFMWNEHVHYSASAWTYSPLKYWPNETKKDSQSPQATSDHADKLSFFAYAPYVAEASGIYTGKLTGPTYSDNPAKNNSNITSGGGGIEAVIANNATGNDPWVRYAVATSPNASVDLLWGVAPSGGLSYTNVAGGTTTITEGEPLVNLIKPNKDQKIKFLFQHALARIGMTIVAAVDQIAPGGNLDSNTKIVVKSVQLDEVTGTKQLKMNGALNLKNTTAYQALWEETSGDLTGLTVTNADLLNPDIEWDTDAATSFAKAGVTTTEKPVIKDGSGNLHYFMVIPNHANTDLQVTITYDVITHDPKVAGEYSVVENVIKKTVTINSLTNNKAYNLKLILGLTSVKLEAEVADWEVDGTTNVNLPKNEE